MSSAGAGRSLKGTSVGVPKGGTRVGHGNFFNTSMRVGPRGGVSRGPVRQSFGPTGAKSGATRGRMAGRLGSAGNAPSRVRRAR